MKPQPTQSILYRSRNSMKNSLLLIIVLSLLSIPAFGSHYLGMSVGYEMIATNTMRVHQYDYHECSGVPFNYVDYNTVTGIGSACTGPVPLGAAVGVSITEITPVCPGTATTCGTPGSLIYGVMERHLYRDYDITNVTCPDISILSTTCCRNGGALNVVSPSSQSGLGFGTTSLAALQMGNNSPVWRENPMVYSYTVSSMTAFDQGATDPDGDSLVYSFTVPQGGNGPLTYTAGYSLTSPLGPDWVVDLDPATGLITFDPLPGAGGTIVTTIIDITVEEYRAGILLGSYTRDMQVRFFPSAANQPSNPPTHTGLQNPAGGILHGDTFVVPVNGTFCIDIAAEDVDPGDMSYLTTFFTGITPATLTDTNGATTGYVIGEDPVGRFCGANPAMGSYPLIAGVRDDSCGAQGYDLHEYTIMVGDTGVVWPGDANDDLVADVNDLLAIGLSFGNTGPARSSVSNAWTGQFAFPWQDTIAGGVDFKHQDCDGNGVVNQDDTLAIVLNLGLTHSKTTGLAGGPDDPPLVMVIPTDTAFVGDTIHAPIYLGDASHPVQNGYGIAFTINYDASLIDSNSFYITFDNNWMGGPPNSLDLSINDHVQSRCDAAFVRTDKMAAVGTMGQIATAHFIIIDNIDGKRNLLVADTLGFAFSNVNLINVNGVAMPTNPSPTEMIVVDNVVEIGEGPLDKEIAIYPNPSQEWVIVEAPGQLIESIELIDLNGKLVQNAVPTSERVRLNLEERSAGMYFLRIHTQSGIQVRKLLID